MNSVKNQGSIPMKTTKIKVPSNRDIERLMEEYYQDLGEAPGEHYDDQ